MEIIDDATTTGLFLVKDGRDEEGWKEKEPAEGEEEKEEDD